MKKLIPFLTLLVFFISNSMLVASVPPPASGGNPTCWPPPCIPVDSGIVFLMIAGVIYGAKKFYDVRKNALTQN